MYIKEELKPRKVFQDNGGRMVAIEISEQNLKKKKLVYMRQME